MTSPFIMLLGSTIPCGVAASFSCRSARCSFTRITLAAGTIPFTGDYRAVPVSPVIGLLEGLGPGVATLLACADVVLVQLAAVGRRDARCAQWNGWLSSRRGSAGTTRPRSGGKRSGVNGGLTRCRGDAHPAMIITWAEFRIAARRR